MFEHQYFLISFSDAENGKMGKGNYAYVFKLIKKSKGQKVGWCLWISFQNDQQWHLF